MTSPDTTRLDTTITREINAWPPAGLANDDQVVICPKIGWTA